MKLTDFGLWFGIWRDGSWKWSTTIPPKADFSIYYDGRLLGRQDSRFTLIVRLPDKYLGIRMKNPFDYCQLWDGEYQVYIGRLLTLDDFSIELNPDYKGPHENS